MGSSEHETYLTVIQTAERLALKPATIRRWVLCRRIAVNRFGRAVRISEREVQRLIEKGFIPARPA